MIKTVSNAKANGDGAKAPAGDGAIVHVDESQVSIASSVISADELLDLFTVAEEEYQLAPGRHAIIRSLTYAEVKRLVAQNRGDQDELELAALVVGTKFPHITPEMMATLRQAKAGPLMNMARRIMVISGMMDDDKSMGEGGASS